MVVVDLAESKARGKVVRLRHGATLPRLSERSTRVRLLAWSYGDACVSSDVAARGSKPSSRALVRNDELWLAGSYAEFERVLDELRGKSRILSVRFQKAWLVEPFVARGEGARTVAERQRMSPLAVLREDQRARWALNFVAARMPASIFVPAVISEAAGYTPQDAKRWERPGWRAA